MARRKNSPDEGQSEPSFEDALAGLESIVEAMEHENLPLEDLVAHYEKGSTLLKRCESILESARERIELITLRNDSNEAPAKTGTQTAAPSQSEPSDDTDDDDIRLF
jgi:exodeoxyribonuclease VII small subunit